MAYEKKPTHEDKQMVKNKPPLTQAAKDARFKAAYGSEPSLPDADNVEEPKPKEGRLNAVNLAKLFLKNDDKMTDYAQQLREIGVCTAENPEVTIKVPGDRSVQLLWRGKSGISVKPVE